MSFTVTRVIVSTDQTECSVWLMDHYHLLRHVQVGDQCSSRPMIYFKTYQIYKYISQCCETPPAVCNLLCANDTHANIVLKHYIFAEESTDDSTDGLTSITCSKPTIDNGNVSPLSDSVAVGENYTITCDGSYTTFGGDEMECNDDGTLSIAPACIS